MKGITPVKDLQFTFNSSWLTWSPPLFSSENSLILYHIYIENKFGQLLYNNMTKDTSYDLYNLTVCDIYIATVTAYSGGYSSRKTMVQYGYTGGIIKLLIIYQNLYIVLYRKLCQYIT